MSVGEDDDVVRHGLEVILGEADRLSGLVEELLDFSRMESGKLTITPSLNDPLKIIGDVVDMYGPKMARQHKLSLVFRRSQKGPKKIKWPTATVSSGCLP